MAETKNAEVTVQIKPPNLRIAEFKIRGTAPYVQNKFSKRIQQEIRKTQEAGSQGKSKKKREPKDFQRLFEDAQHVSTEGWRGIPAPAFRNAMISACRLVGFKMTHAKLSVFVVADGFDDDDGTPLVKIEGEPEIHEGAVRNQSGVIDLRWRPMWREWSCTLHVRFDGDQFSETDVANLLARAGAQVGIGEGRPDSRESAGLGWGMFEIAND